MKENCLISFIIKYCSLKKSPPLYTDSLTVGVLYNSGRLQKLNSLHTVFCIKHKNLTKKHANFYNKKK
jgi:hypothetical protein